MIDTFRSHLGQAGAGDVALFSYSGHGSEEPAPPEFAELEASGRIQTLVPVDVGRRRDGPLVRPIADKELAVLIAEVAARGPHVVVLLDCCHSGSGTRDAAATPRQWLPDPGRGPRRATAPTCASWRRCARWRTSWPGSPTGRRRGPTTSP